mmetsp:Transcript_84885/g.253014  ORF Transcript_84885/g.253014 Transcript_84885/m.253014 type:complete len:261 (-) Transcript_84885:508-1290(-)
MRAHLRCGPHPLGQPLGHLVRGLLRPGLQHCVRPGHGQVGVARPEEQLRGGAQRAVLRRVLRAPWGPLRLGRPELPEWLLRGPLAVGSVPRAPRRGPRGGGRRERRPAPRQVRRHADELRRPLCAPVRRRPVEERRSLQARHGDVHLGFGVLCLDTLAVAGAPAGTPLSALCREPRWQHGARPRRLRRQLAALPGPGRRVRPERARAAVDDAPAKQQCCAEAGHARAARGPAGCCGAERADRHAGPLQPAAKQVACQARQ